MLLFCYLYWFAFIWCCPFIAFINLICTYLYWYFVFCILHLLLSYCNLSFYVVVVSLNILFLLLLIQVSKLPNSWTPTPALLRHLNLGVARGFAAFSTSCLQLPKKIAIAATNVVCQKEQTMEVLARYSNPGYSSLDYVVNNLWR